MQLQVLPKRTNIFQEPVKLNLPGNVVEDGEDEDGQDVATCGPGVRVMVEGVADRHVPLDRHGHREVDRSKVNFTITNFCRQLF